MAVIGPLKAVGYWWSPEAPEYPHPGALIDPDFPAAERERIVAYLNGGSIYVQWRGLSYCRLQCGVSCTEMGSRCLTDGVWVWPQGLAHYVEQHQVRLPGKFLSLMRRRHWKIPEHQRMPTRETHGEPDDHDWIEWGRSQS